jgi:hypothetical protein
LSIVKSIEIDNVPAGNPFGLVKTAKIVLYCVLFGVVAHVETGDFCDDVEDDETGDITRPRRYFLPLVEADYPRTVGVTYSGLIIQHYINSNGLIEPGTYIRVGVLVGATYTILISMVEDWLTPPWCKRQKQTITLV